MPDRVPASVKIKQEPVTPPVEPKPTSPSAHNSTSRFPSGNSGSDSAQYEPYVAPASCVRPEAATEAPVAEADDEPSLLLSEHAEKMLNLAEEHEEAMQSVLRRAEAEMISLREENQRLQAALQVSTAPATGVPAPSLVMATGISGEERRMELKKVEASVAYLTNALNRVPHPSESK